MKILMLTPYFPYPPHSGGQTRSYNLIKHLGEKHEITLFSLIKDESERQYIGELQKYCKKVRIFARPPKPWTIKNVLRTAFSNYPFLVIRNFADEEKKAVSDELKNEKYDLIHAENFYTMPYIPETEIPVVFIEQTIFYRVYQHYAESLPWYLCWLKPIFMLDIRKLRYWENHFLKTAHFTAAVSEEDRQHIQELTGRKKIYIVPNGVDFKQFSERRYEKSKTPVVLFGLADFHWMQNKEGVEILMKSIWPKIKSEVKNAKLWIVGKIAPQVLSQYLGEKDVLIEEIEDSREAYQKAWILVAPIRSGGGSRTKFFEAMASGLPIVTTGHGIEGIMAVNNKEAIIRDNLDKLAEEAIKLLQGKRLREAIGKKAQELVKREYTWESSAKQLDRLYEEATNARKKN
ncbi:MAG TPA: glycosyltransferase family 4 protein [Patescibacteria group bacterium]|nr:glycosyltransferase family 4 protein [Patescibacteria group bacterium]